MFAMNQESSLIGITINDTGKAIGRWWSHTSITFMVVGVGGLKKASLPILSSMYFNSSTTQTEIVGVFFYIIISPSLIYFL